MFINEGFILLFPLVFSFVLLLASHFLFFKDSDLFSLVRNNGGLDSSTGFGRDFNAFFTLIKLFFFITIADMLLLPAVLSLIVSLGLLSYPTYVLFKYVPAGKISV